MCRLTSPCSSLTALAARESFSASTVMQNGSCSSSGFTRPRPSSSLNGTFNCVQEPLHRVIHQLRREAVVAGLHRRVRGENAFRLGQRLRLGEGFAGGHFFADQFQREKRRVAFVHVERGRLDAQRAQQPHAADAQQNFLHDARGAVAAINAAGQVAEMLLVFRQVRVQQKHRHAAHVHAPDLEVHRVHADFHAAHQPVAVRVQHRLQRHVVRVNGIVIFRLPVVRSQSPAGNSLRGRTGRCPQSPGRGRWRISRGRRPGCPGRRRKSAATRGSRTPPRNTPPGFLCSFGALTWHQVFWSVR